MGWHKLMAKAIANQRALIAALSAVLGVLVAFGVIRPSSEQAILAVAGIIFAWLGGSAYVEGKHVEAVARTSGSGPGTAMDAPKAS